MRHYTLEYDPQTHPDLFTLYKLLKKTSPDIHVRAVTEHNHTFGFCAPKEQAERIQKLEGIVRLEKQKQLR